MNHSRDQHHRVTAVFEPADAAIFHLPPGATLGDLCARLDDRCRGLGASPIQVKIAVGQDESRPDRLAPRPRRQSIGAIRP